MGAVGAFHGVLGREGGKDRRDAFQVAAETHVEVPLIVDFERLDPMGRRMVRAGQKTGFPGGIDRPVGLKIAAHPLHHAFAAGAHRHLDAIMQTGQPRSGTHDFV